MSDHRAHRGAHPEDAQLFAADQWPALRRAQADLCWLLDRGYAMRSGLALVGDRHALTQRQRIAVARCACSAAQQAVRAGHEVTTAALAQNEIWLDGYNVLITVESALSGGVILLGRDGCYRDMASLHGSYRRVEETVPALRAIGETLVAVGATSCRWLLDQPVSNSGRLRGILEDLAAEHRWPWEVTLVYSPDKLLRETEAIVATSDSVVLDACARWYNLARHVVSTHAPQATVIALEEPPDVAGG